MLSALKQKKFTHLFQILDFDHDGLLQESDFLSLGENISIFRCLQPPSKIEELINRRGEQIWKSLQNFSNKQEMAHCNLENWLKLMQQITEEVPPKYFDIIARKAVRDIFFIYDKNMDNYLSKHEYLCFFVSLRVGIKQADNCFRALDLNDDMMISKEELYSAIHEFFRSEDEKSPGNLLFGDFEDYQFKTRHSFQL